MQHIQAIIINVKKCEVLVNEAESHETSKLTVLGDARFIFLRLFTFFDFGDPNNTDVNFYWRWSV